MNLMKLISKFRNKNKNFGRLNTKIKEGFLVVKKFNELYYDYVQRYDLKKPLYAIPRLDLKPEDLDVQYRGIDRDAINPFHDHKNPAAIKVAELEMYKKSLEGFVFSFDDIQVVFDKLAKPNSYEVIWIKLIKSKKKPPENYISIGFFH